MLRSFITQILFYKLTSSLCVKLFCSDFLPKKYTPDDESYIDSLLTKTQRGRASKPTNNPTKLAIFRLLDKAQIKYLTDQAKTNYGPLLPPISINSNFLKRFLPPISLQKMKLTHGHLYFSIR